MRTKSRHAARWRRRPTDPQQEAAPVDRVDEATAVAAARGDIAAWAAVIRENQELVFRSVYLGTGDITLSEDTTILAFVYAYRSLGSLGPGASFQPWLLRLADSCARVRLRELTQRPDATTLGPGRTPRVPATPVHLPPGTPTPTRTDHDVLVDAFHVLTREDRNVIAARFAFGFGRDDAAARMLVESDAVDGMLAASLARLRSRVAATMGSRLQEAPTGDRVSEPMVLGQIGGLSDDQLGSMTMAAVISELRWAPDVMSIVCERVAREAWAYPEMRTAMPAADARSSESSSDATRPTAVRSWRPSGPSGPQAAAAILGASLVVGTFVYGADLIGQESGVAADERIALATKVGGAGAIPPIGSATEAVPASRPVAMSGGSVASMTASGSTSTPGSVGPVVASPAVSLVDARRLKGVLSGVVRVAWPASIDTGSTVSAELEWKAGDSGWAPVTWSETGDPLHATIKPGTRYRFRVRALDVRGDEMVSDTASVKLALRGPRSDRIDRSRKGWRTRQRPSGHQRLVATKPGARIRTEFRGADVVIVGPGSSTRDVLHVRIDDGPWVRDQNPGKRADSPVLFSDSLDPGRHSIDIRATDDGLAVDAILILRSQDA